MSPQPVSLKTIAAECGISAAAVSLALSGKSGRISEATRKKIFACAEKLHYCGNPAARMLRRKRTDQITLVLPPFFSGIPGNLDFNAHVRQMQWQLIFGVIAHAAETGYDVKLLPMTPQQDLTALPARLDRTRTDGVIFLSGSYFRKIFPELNVPKVAAEFTRSFAESDVDIDPLPGFRQALEHLIAERKFSRFGCAVPLHTTLNYTRKYLEQIFSGNSLPPLRFFDTPDDFGILKLAQSGALRDVDAVFCGNDAIASRLLRSCRACGKETPVIIGYDNNPVWHDFPTISIDRDRFAAAAVEQLLAAMQGKSVSHIRIPARFWNR